MSGKPKRGDLVRDNDGGEGRVVEPSIAPAGDVFVDYGPGVGTWARSAGDLTVVEPAGEPQGPETER